MSELAPSAIAFEDVGFSYGDHRALDRVSFELPRGGVVALLGPNGAGKTTSVALVLGLARPEDGYVQVAGKNPDSAKARQGIGAMLQTSGVPPTLKVEELIKQFSTYYANPMTTEAVLEITKLAPLRDRRFAKLSGGQQQRVLFALAICGDPDLLVLDEPTTGMDVEVRRDFWRAIRGMASRDKTVLLTTHYLEEADALADRIIVLREGSVVADGTPDAIKSTVGARQISATTTLTDTALAALPGVIDVGHHGRRARVLSATPEAAVREWINADQSLSDLEVRGAALEEAFIALTQQESA